MENRENKIIQNKINSMDQLPEGYEPNLHAKWALLEDSLNEKKSAVVWVNYKWLGIAAVLLILFSTGFWFSSRDNKPKHIVKDELNAAPGIPENKKADNKIISPQIEKQIVQRKSNGIRTEISTALHHDKIKSEEQEFPNQDPSPMVDNTVKSDEEIILAESNQSSGLVEIPNKKVNKRRYVQVDFVSPNATTALSKESNQQIIRFKIGSSGRNSANAIPETGEPFLLFRQNF